MSDFETGWVLVGHSADEGTEQLFSKLSSYGIIPKEFMLYGDIRTFIRANSLPENEAMAFHKGHFIGNIGQVDDYLNGRGLRN